MPKGTHTSTRVALAVPPKVHEQLKAWADYEGRPVASLCMYLIENALRQAQRDGIAPSFDDEAGDIVDKWNPTHRIESISKQDQGNAKRFTQSYEDMLAEQKLRAETKKEKLLQLLQELTE
jgi:hypothetical protein